VVIFQVGLFNIKEGTKSNTVKHRTLVRLKRFLKGKNQPSLKNLPKKFPSSKIDQDLERKDN